MTLILTLDFFDLGEVEDTLKEEEFTRIASMISEGFLAGEIVQENTRGWWSLTEAES